MAWRIHDNLIDGELDNTGAGRVTETLRFVGTDEAVTLDVEGHFEGELRGKRIHLCNPHPGERSGGQRLWGRWGRTGAERGRKSFWWSS